MNEKIKKPSLFLYLSEIFRAIYQTILGFFYVKRTPPTSIKSDKIIMVIPGLLCTDLSTTLLRQYLQKLGYRVYGWEMGRNLGRIENIETLANKIELLSKKHNQKVTLIGWSMGGIFAREVAKLKTDYVDRVLTIGSPFANVYAPNHAKWIFDLLNDSKDLKPEIVNQLSEPPPQPTAALYSLSDGIVPWQACMDTPTSELHQNYKIESSHFGMGANPTVLAKVRDLLTA